MDESPKQAAYPPMPPPAPRAQPARGRSATGWIVGGIALAVVFLMMVFVCGTCFLAAGIFRGGPAGRGVGLIEITGVLASDSAGLSGTSSQSVVRQLVKARESRNIKSVLIRIDSPGGTPAAAQEIYTEINRTKMVKPVVVSIGDLGASAAYYLASASNLIYASADSDVGSIGVILEIPNVQGLDNKIGVQWYIYTQGQYKDIGSPFRPPTQQEAEILQGQMKVAYDHFIKDVAAGRHMDESKVRELATGITWPGAQAKEIGLIDNIGNYQDALNKAGDLGGIKGEVKVIRLSDGGPFGLFGDFMMSLKEIANSLRSLVQENGMSNERPNER